MNHQETVYRVFSGSVSGLVACMFILKADLMKRHITDRVTVWPYSNN